MLQGRSLPTAACQSIVWTFSSHARPAEPHPTGYLRNIAHPCDVVIGTDIVRNRSVNRDITTTALQDTVGWWQFPPQNRLKSAAGAERSFKWKVIVNVHVEPDE